MSQPYLLYETDPTYQMAVKQLKDVAALLGLPEEIIAGQDTC